ncbi:ABC transporter permease [Ectothiorhodospiraceae bacterium WFHF3C12]|nr:ABC transporter permease [Ectothiorhodospiraceae bacterium WFHF3C12]
MRAEDFTRLTLRSVLSQRLRSFLTGLGIAIGIAAVILLTSIGEGVNQFVISEFSQFGTNIVAIQPGKSETFGGSVGAFGTDRPLTMEDAQALERVPHVTASMGVVQGNAEVEGGGRSRRTTILGVGPEMPEVFRFDVALGRFLPPDDPTQARPMVVLGSKVHEELFRGAPPMGELMRIGGSRYRVVGVMAPKGQILGFDMDDAVYIPTARALELFDREGVMEIDLLYREGAPVDEVTRGTRRILELRHGRVDFTIVTQEEMLSTLGSVLDVLTFAVGALGGISLFVGGVGILTIMTINVRERTAEIGLLRALGARRRTVLGLFLGEAVVLAFLGGVAGLGLGVGIAQGLHWLLPVLPVQTPWLFAVLALAMAAIIGLGAGVGPAVRASRLDPVEALREE